MISYIKRHEHYVKEMLEKNLSIEALKDLLEYHDKQIQWMQHGHCGVFIFPIVAGLLANVFFKH